MRPISSLVRIRLGQILMRRYNITPDKAIEMASDLVEDFRKYNLDIVDANWVTTPAAPEPKMDFWEAVSALHEQMKDSAWTPWKP